MGEQKRIVTEDYPVENLPEDLRRGIAPGHRVTVTVEEIEDRWSDLFARIDAYQASSSRHITEEDAVSRVRSLRDEWD